MSELALKTDTGEADFKSPAGGLTNARDGQRAGRDQQRQHQ
jgi:hypothetical protein